MHTQAPHRWSTGIELAGRLASPSRINTFLAETFRQGNVWQPCPGRFPVRHRPLEADHRNFLLAWDRHKVELRSQRDGHEGWLWRVGTSLTLFATNSTAFQCLTSIPGETILRRLFTFPCGDFCNFRIPPHENMVKISMCIRQSTTRVHCAKFQNPTWGCGLPVKIQDYLKFIQNWLLFLVFNFLG